MSIEPTGAQDRHDQARAPGERPSFLEIVRGFGVMIGPSLLLDLFVAGSSLALWLVGSCGQRRGSLACCGRPRVPRRLDVLLYYLLTFEIPHFVMERRMLLGVKERAERAEDTRMASS